MGCDWINGESVAVGYAINNEALFPFDTKDDTIGYDGEIEEGEFDPYETIRADWKAFLEKHGHQDIIDKSIEPHIGVTEKPGSYESCRYKSCAVVVFGVNIMPTKSWYSSQEEKEGGGDEETSEDEDVVALPAVTFPGKLHSIVKAFVKDFLDNHAKDEQPEKKRKTGDSKDGPATKLKTVIFVC